MFILIKTIISVAFSGSIIFELFTELKKENKSLFRVLVLCLCFMIFVFISFLKEESFISMADKFSAFINSTYNKNPTTQDNKIITDIKPENNFNISSKCNTEFENAYYEHQKKREFFSANFLRTRNNPNQSERYIFICDFLKSFKITADNLSDYYAK